MEQREIKVVDIPEIFLSSETKKPISNCQICNINLLDSDAPYMVEKIIKRYNYQDYTTTLFELAICFPCAQQMRDALSDKSKQKVMEYFIANVDFMGRTKGFYDKDMFDVNDWVSECIFNNKQIDEINEYHLFAQCQGNKMIFDLMPYMMSLEAEEDIQELLSEETKGELDDFMKRNFSFPPEFEDIFKDKPIFVF